MKLLSKGNTNAKTTKNKLTTFILYLAPWRQNELGINICADATDGCIEACLFTAGRGKFNSVQSARINKTNFLVKNRAEFYTQLLKEINNKIKYYSRKNETIAFRLNGTSDLDHFKYIKAVFKQDLEQYKAQFYDYTKSIKRAYKYKDSKNYTIALSRSESNETQCLEALKAGINCAFVFAGDLPTQYKGFKVVDGDSSDDIMIKYKNKGVILGLRAKGEAKKDKSGFVITNY